MITPKKIDAAALIIAGGRSTRFWPEGRADRPKPLFSVTGDSSLILDTIARIQPLIPRERIFVLVTDGQRRAFRSELRGTIAPHNLIIEPEGRGTTVAIAYGSAMIAERFGKDVIIVTTPADHYIPQANAFRSTIGKAIRAASEARAIVVVGVKPTRPETGYGYQQVGQRIKGGFKVARFIEKPPLERARRMLLSGQFLWNAGIFAMSPAVLLIEMQQHLSPLAAAMERFAKMKLQELRSVYRQFDVASFDREIAEKSNNLVGVRAKFEWHDVGSWHGLWTAMRGSNSNVISDGIVTDDVQGVLARGGKRLMVLLGVKDLVAVDTDDAILIASLSRSQELSRVLETLRQRGLQSYL
jgi:mannose-1-phosphate guanylyltransferase